MSRENSDKSTQKSPQQPSRRAANGRHRTRGGRPRRRGHNGRQRRERTAGVNLPQQDRVFPQIRFPSELPVSERQADIEKAIAENQVVIIAGETGSGKTTQIPKMCLNLGRGKRQRIGHTQPRRIAARSVADRIAEELGSSTDKPDSLVGYKIRFDDKTSENTAVKLMTDGVLLNEIQRDRLLREYDTIIIDEAHERSLNIDFLLGYLKNLLPKRPDLKLIITSATIDPESFAEHFASADGTPAPIVEVSGRTYPVEILYRPLERSYTDPNGGEITTHVTDPLDGLIEAVDELWSFGSGDILCFFSGEREIRDAAEALDKHLNRDRRGALVDILPLFGRLSNAEQHRVFNPGQRRRIVLATNIAETSLTVPGIRFVVDTGYARISRYSNRTKVQRLPVEEISQASAKQRSGRCGRVADGIAIRLYSQENFEARPEFTDPEILRTHLASVILAMLALGLGDIQKFPFLQAPDSRAVRDGVALLSELGAISGGDRHALTDVGRDMSRIPTDPRLARMMVAAHRLNILDQVTVIVAALSIQDVRERPLEKQQQADEFHARFKANSDFISTLKLWSYLQQQRAELSGNQFRKLCQREFIHYLRVLEWADLVRQLLNIAKELRWSVPNIQHVRQLTFDGEPIAEDDVHRALLAGLISHIGMREGESRQFTGPRNSHFVVHPSSHVAKKPPQWIMAAELVETSRIFARTVGPIRPEWVESIAPHMVKYTHSEPHWSSKRGAAMVYEKALLLGLPIVTERRVNLGRIDPELARDMFIRKALVEGDWETRHKFYRHNQELLEQAEKLEDKARRRDIVIDDDALFSFYDARLPADIISSRHFDSWWKKARHKKPDLLDFSLDALIDSHEGAAEANEFPDTWRQGSLEFDLEYVFDPTDPRDGITMQVPLPLLANIDPEITQWLVPGMRHELAVALIRSLPKAIRKSVVPATDFAARALEAMTPYDGAIDESLADALRSLGGRGINATDFDWTKVPDHLRMNFAVIDRRGNVVRTGRDIVALQRELAGDVRQAIAAASARSLRGGQGSTAASPLDAKVHQKGAGAAGNKGRGAGGKQKAAQGGAGVGGVLQHADEWSTESIGDIPESIETVVDGQAVNAFPALVASFSAGKTGHRSTRFELKAFPTEQAAKAQQFSTVLGLMAEATPISAGQMLKGLPLRQRVALENYPNGGIEALVDDARTAACRQLLEKIGPVIRTPDECERACQTARQQAPGLVRQILVAFAPAALAIQDISAELEQWDGPAIAEMKKQVQLYAADHSLVTWGIQRLRHVPRYVEAMKERLALLERDPDREAELAEELADAMKVYQQTVDRLPSARQASPQVKDLRWLIEELMVALFAQHLGTARSASLQRVRKAASQIR